MSRTFPLHSEFFADDTKIYRELENENKSDTGATSGYRSSDCMGILEATVRFNPDYKSRSGAYMREATARVYKTPCYKLETSIKAKVSLCCHCVME